MADETYPEMRARHKAEIAASIQYCVDNGMSLTGAAPHLGITVPVLDNLARRHGVRFKAIGVGYIRPRPKSSPS